jgi:hypothetical protein
MKNEKNVSIRIKTMTLLILSSALAVSIAVNIQQYNDRKMLVRKFSKTVNMLGMLQKSMLVLERPEIDFVFSPDLKLLIEESYTFDSLGQVKAIHRLDSVGQYFNDVAITNAFCHQ